MDMLERAAAYGALGVLFVLSCGTDVVLSPGAAGSSSSVTGGSSGSSSVGGNHSGSGSSGGEGGGCPNDFELQGPTPECTPCAEKNCCAELTACAADPACARCFDPMGGCSIPPSLTALNQCKGTACLHDCGPPPPLPPPRIEPACDAPALSPSGGSCVVLAGDVACNPVTNEPCNSQASEACDFNGSGFKCYPDDNVHAICEQCGPWTGKFCKGGMSCMITECARYCCADADCGSGICKKDYFGAVPVGICVLP